MHRGVAIVDHESLGCDLVREIYCPLAITPALECILEVRECKAGVRARERRIELQRGEEEPLGFGVVRLAVTVHVPQAAVIRLPRVE